MKADEDKCSATGRKSLNLAGPNDLPATVDWREKKIVSPVRDQGNCGSCWTYSTAGTYESHYAIKT